MSKRREKTKKRNNLSWCAIVARYWLALADLAVRQRANAYVNGLWCAWNGCRPSTCKGFHIQGLDG